MTNLKQGEEILEGVRKIMNKHGYQNRTMADEIIELVLSARTVYFIQPYYHDTRQDVRWIGFDYAEGLRQLQSYAAGDEDGCKMWELMIYIPAPHDHHQYEMADAMDAGHISLASLHQGKEIVHNQHALSCLGIKL